MSTSHINAADFKARCLALLDQVHKTGEPITITKRGRVVAELVAAGQADDRPWARLGGKARWSGDPIEPIAPEDRGGVR
jgi:prevent-host-death family protein